MNTVQTSRPPVARPGQPPTRPARPGGAIAMHIDPIRVLRRHMIGIICSGILGGLLGVAAFFLLLRLFPMYSGEAVFEVTPGLQESDQVGGGELGSDAVVFRIAGTEVMLLTSREILNKAVNNIEIRQTKWHEHYIRDDGTFAVDDAVDELEESVGANVVRGTNLFRLAWSTHEPSDVPIVLNCIARAYLDQRKAQDASIFTENLEIFNSQHGQTQRDLDDLNLAIQRFIREKGMDTLKDTQFSQEAFERQSLTEQIAQARHDYSLANTSYQQVSAKLEGAIEPTSDDILQAELDPTMQYHNQLMMSLNTELRRAYDKYDAGHPIVRDVEQRLRAAELQKDSRLDEIMTRNLQAAAKQLSQQIEQLADAIDGMEEEAELTDAELRELAASQSSYEAMVNRRDHLEAARDADLQLIKEVQLMRLREDASRVRLVRYALTPREVSFPKKEIVIPLGVLLLVALTVGFIFLREITDQRVKSASDLAVLPGANILGVIPELDEDPTKSEAAELVVRRHPNSVLAESYRQASAPIMRTMDRSGYQVLLLVGGLPGAGTTTVATNFAMTASAAGKRVVVVDANFRRPRLEEALGESEPGQGFGDVLAGEASIDGVLREVGEDVYVIGAGTPGNRVFERLSNGRYDTFIAELRSRFDLIIFDAPPAVVAGDAMVLAGKVDAAVLIVRAYQEHRGLVSRLIGQLADAHCDLLGILLNRPRGTAGGYFKKNYATMAEYGVKSGK